MMKILLTVSLIFVLVSCERKPFVEHKLALEKKSDGCTGLAPTFRMTSNFGGERFEFQKCLSVEHAKDIISERHGDTVLVKFSTTDAGPKAVYEVTLDIDSYPKYSFITIDDETYSIIPTNNN